MGMEPREHWERLDLDRFPSPSPRGRRIWTIVIVAIGVLVVAGWARIFLAD